MNNNDFLNALQATFAAKSTDEVKNASAFLTSFESEVLGDVSKFIALSFAKELDKTLRLSVANFTKKTIMKNVKLTNIEENKMMSLLSSVISPLISSNEQLDDKVVNIYTLLILEMLSESNFFISRPSTIVDIVNELTKKTTMLNASVITLIHQSIVSSKSTNEENVSAIITAQLALIKGVIDANSDCTLLRKVLDLLSLTIKKLSILSEMKMDDIVNNYANILCEGICAVIAKFSDDKNFVTFKQSSLPQAEIAMINSLKAKCFLVLTYFIQFSHEKAVTHQKLLTVMPLMIKKIMSSLKDIVDHHIEEIANDEYQIEILIYQMLFILSRLITREPFHTEFHSQISSFVFNIIFPLLSSSENEINNINESPEEYYASLIDTMYDFRLKKVKTVCGYILTRICETYDGTSRRILNFIFQMLNFNMNEINDSNISAYSLIKNEIGLYLINNYSPEILIDTSLLFLCILARHALQNEEISLNLANFLLNSQMRMINLTSEIIQYKICLIYGLFMEDLFDEDNNRDFITKSMNFLLNLIINVNDRNIGLCYQAMHSFDQLIDSDKFAEIAKGVVASRLDVLIKMINNVKIDIFFDVINSMIRRLKMENVFTSLIAALIQRFGDEVAKSGGKSNVFITKELKCIKSIIENKTGDNAQIITAIVPIINLFKNMNGIDFIDEIAEILHAMTFTAQSLNILNDLSPCYVAYLKHSQGMNEVLFKILNKIFITKSISINYATYLDIISTSFALIDEYAEDPSPIFTLTLSSILLIHRGGIAAEEISSLIEGNYKKFTDVVGIYQDNIDQLNRTCDAYLIWGYLTMIFSSFVNYSNASLDVLMKLNGINNLIKYTELLIKSNFFSTSWAKISLLGMCNMLYNDKVLKEIFVLLEKMFDLLYLIVLRQSIELKSDYYINDLNNEDRDESDDEVDVKKKEEVINESGTFFDKMISVIRCRAMNRSGMFTDDNKVIAYINKGNFAIDALDEFDAFSKVVNKLKSFSETKTIVENYIKKMDVNEQKVFDNVIHMRRVTINATTVPRRILKIKRKYN